MLKPRFIALFMLVLGILPASASVETLKSLGTVGKTGQPSGIHNTYRIRFDTEKGNYVYTKDEAQCCAGDFTPRIGANHDD